MHGFNRGGRDPFDKPFFRGWRWSDLKRLDIMAPFYIVAIVIGLFGWMVATAPAGTMDHLAESVAEIRANHGFCDHYHGHCDLDPYYRDQYGYHDDDDDHYYPAIVPVPVYAGTSSSTATRPYRTPRTASTPGSTYRASTPTYRATTSSGRTYTNRSSSMSGSSFSRSSSSSSSRSSSSSSSSRSSGSRR